MSRRGDRCLGNNREPPAVVVSATPTAGALGPPARAGQAFAATTMISTR